MSVATVFNYTYDDYKEWEGEWELIDGYAVAMAPAPVKKHRRIAGDIFVMLKTSLSDECVECEVLYEVDWKVSQETVLRPDIVLSCYDEKENYITLAPKLIVEVLSPSTAKKDETIKFDIYQKEGVEYYILVYPNDEKAKVYTLKDGRYIKLGDYTSETISLDERGCFSKIDFSKVFKKI